jgi:hypothetical protein
MVLTAAMTATVAPAAAAAPASASGGNPIAANAAWILSAQLPDGAIANYTDRLAVSPYLANLAAMGLARATEVTGDPRYGAAAWQWLLWYQAHENATTGFVTDYQITAQGEVSTGDMDSTDAYAGTFLLAVWRTWKATGSGAALTRLHAGVTQAVRAIESTQDADGLTWAKPAYHVKYLMDQAETEAGLRAAATVATALGDPALASRAALDASRMQAGVDKLWNPAAAAYDWAVFSSGPHQGTNWSVLYPDAMEQVWAVAFGLTGGARAQAIMTHLGVAHPNWDRPTATDLFSSGPAVVGYWPVAGLALVQIGQRANAAVAAGAIQSAATLAQQAWPFTTGVAGSLIQLQSADPLFVPAPPSTLIGR